MHIPDGYLSPETCIALYGAAAPFWYKASQRMKQVMTTRMVPLLAIFAAFSFTIQMLNFPVPGGTSAHAVGGTLMAVVLGPWPAVIGMSVSLTIQALFFGDGGVTALGANVFDLGIVLPLTGYAVYRLLSGANPSPQRRAIAAALGAYVGLNVGALLVALQLGIQPMFWSVDGQALYNPYDLSVAVPAIMSVHLTLAGAAEALFTGLVVAYLLRTSPHVMLADARNGDVSGPKRGVARGVLIVLGALVLLTPLGLLATGTPFGEWGTEEFGDLVGYVPPGLEGLGQTWQWAPFVDYQLPGASEATFAEAAPAYILSAIVGIGLIFVTTVALRMLFARRSS